MAPKRRSQQRGDSGRLCQDLYYSDELFELPDALIEYASEEYEPPKKRQKTQPSVLDRTGGVESLHGDGSADKPLDYIVVNQSTWEIQCDSSKLSNIESPLERTNLKAYVSWDKARGPQYISFTNDKEGGSFTFELPEDIKDRDDVLLALDIHRESCKWAKYQGKIWTEVGLLLFQRDDVDRVQMVFTIKWNVTYSIRNVFNARQMIPSLKTAMDRYFPDPNVTQSETWTPQDFYQSVHTPNKDDEIAATIDIDIKSILFPFQKRAVRWLLRREGMDWSGRDIRPRDTRDILNGPLSPAFIEAEDARGQPCFVSSLYGCATLDLQQFQNIGQDIRGGILAEEMGLGKTLEIISLITLHRRPQEGSSALDPYTLTNVRPIGTTLIICPPTLVQQWISEIHKHSHLKVMHYEGISKVHKEMSAEQLRDNLIGSDVVISTYAVLAGEINYTPLNPEKKLRYESRYKRPKSPLMEFSWWRICIDEAQMVESGVSKAATVARILPRVNAWCVTGTPVRRDVNDLLGLLVFLRAEPYATTKHIWTSLLSTHKSEFRRLFSNLALRHNKKTVRDELRLPAQKRYVITMPFTPIEEQHYQELFNQMCRESGLDLEGSPLNPNWDPDQAAEHMRRW